MSKKFGPRTEPLNVTVKGQELPLHDPRLKHIQGFGYAVSPMGADHEANIYDTDYARDGFELKRANSVLKTPVQPLSTKLINEDKLQIFYHELNFKHFLDCGVVCHFVAYAYDHMAEALSGVTGAEYSLQDILDVGARAQTLSRLFNYREGFTAEDDRLPRRVMQAFESGPLAGVEIKQETLDWARQRYYEMMQWDPLTGVPSRECLRSLQLTDFTEIIQQTTSLTVAVPAQPN